MTSLIKYSFLLFISSSVILFAQRVEKIEISGNKVFSEDEIRKWAGLNSGQNYFPGRHKNSKQAG